MLAWEFKDQLFTLTYHGSPLIRFLLCQLFSIPNVGDNKHQVDSIAACLGILPSRIAIIDDGPLYALRIRDAWFNPQNFQQLAHLGYSCEKLLAAGFTAEQLWEAGFTLTQLKDAGLSLAQFKAEGFSARQCQNAGFSWVQLKDVGFSFEALRNTEFSAGLP